MRGDFFLSIVKHKNFSPRLISWLAGFARVRGVAVAEYQEHVNALLDRPELIWRHAFESQISASARSVLLSLVSLGRHVDPIDLRPVWDALHGHNARKYNFKTAPNDFRRALQELEGSFISLNSYGVYFLNPSIRDFMDLVLLDDDNYADDAIASAVRFSQVKGLRRSCHSEKGKRFAYQGVRREPLVSRGAISNAGSSSSSLDQDALWRCGKLYRHDTSGTSLLVREMGER